MVVWSRTLRTASSERFLASNGTEEVAAVDLHYLSNGQAAGTVILLDHKIWDETQIGALLRSLDEQFLPDVDIEAGTLTYTVIRGRVEGVYEPYRQSTT